MIDDYDYFVKGRASHFNSYTRAHTRAISREQNNKRSSALFDKYKLSYNLSSLALVMEVKEELSLLEKEILLKFNKNS